MKWLYNLFHKKCINKIDLLDTTNTVLLNENAELKLKMSDMQTIIDKTNVNEPSPKGTIGYSETMNLLKTKLGNIDINLSDNYFNLIDKDTAKEYSSEAKVAYKKWIAEGHDCDNFSFAAMGYWSQGLISFAYGICWNNKHAFNIMIDNNKEIWIVEPQINKYMTLEEANKNDMYTNIRLVLM